MAHVSESNVDLKRFDVSPERGFLPEADPERALPAPLALWQELASELPKRLAAQSVRAAVRGLQPFDRSGEKSEPSLRSFGRLRVDGCIAQRLGQNRRHAQYRCPAQGRNFSRCPQGNPAAYGGSQEDGRVAA